MTNQLKKLIPLTMSILVVAACGNDTEKDKAVIKETVKTVKEIPKSNDFREILKATKPATEAQFQNWLPNNLGDFKRTEFTKTRISQEDIASAGALYKNGDSKTMELSIVDGASKDGLLAIQSHYMAQNMEHILTKASGYEKTYEKNGLKVLETYVKNDSFYRVEFLKYRRFGITIESYGLSYDELWQAISTLDLNKLNDL